MEEGNIARHFVEPYFTFMFSISIGISKMKGIVLVIFSFFLLLSKKSHENWRTQRCLIGFSLLSDCSVLSVALRLSGSTEEVVLWKPLPRYSLILKTVIQTGGNGECD